MAILSNTVFKALVVVVVTCVPLLIYQVTKDNSAFVDHVTAVFHPDQKKSDPINHDTALSEPGLSAATPVTARSWLTLSSINNGRFESATIQYRDDLYVFNGFGAGIRVQPTVEKYDAGTQSWSVIGKTSIALGNAVTHNGIVLRGNEVWIIGGRLGNHPGAVTSRVWKFNLTTHRWSQGPQLPVPVAAGGAALVDNRIHWFGGLDVNARCDVDNHYVYDLNNPSAGWSDISGIAPMPIPRNHFATVVHEGLIYAIGGQFTHDGCRPGTPNTDLVHVFNPETNIWTQKASLPAPQSHIEPSTFVHKGAIYVVGGQTKGNKIFRYDLENDNWDTVAELPRALLAPVARVVDDQLIVSTGGAPSTTPGITTYATDMKPLLLPGADNTDSSSVDFGASVLVTDSLAEVDSEAGLISLEAEYYDTLSATATHEWVSINSVDASNNAAMTTTPDNGSLVRGAQGSPSMNYFAYFDRPGTWYLWIRGSGDTVNAEGRSDSVHAGLNGSLSATAVGIDNFPSDWSWSSSTRDGVRASLNVPSAGIHAVNLWMREDGLAVDKILLTTDSNYQPFGTGNVPVDNIPASDNEVPPGGTGISDNETASTGNDEVTTDHTSNDSIDNPTGGSVIDSLQPAGAASGLASINGMVVLEVENFDNTSAAGNRQWVRSLQLGASANAAMVTTPDTGALRPGNQGAPVMNYPVFFNEPGNYTVWLRGWGDTVGNEGRSDSVHVGINGTLGSAAAIQNFPASWNWSSERRSGGSATIFVPSSGLHTINIWMREDGLILDKLILASDPNFTPSAQGPAVTLISEETPIDPADSSGVDSNDSTEDLVIDATQSVDNEIVALEVENFDSASAAGNRQWVRSLQSGASANAAMVTTPDTGALRPGNQGAPVMNYPVFFNEPGNYTVWLRGWGDTVGNEGRSDSVHVGINGTLGSAAAIQNFPASWNWSSERRSGGSATLFVPSSGMHTINIWMREDGLILDKLVLASDPSYVPSGSGPAVTSPSDSDGLSNEETTTGAGETDVAASSVVTNVNFSNRWLNQNTSDGSTVQMRHEAGGVVVDGKLYVLGGRGTRSVSVYDPVTNKWSRKAAPPIELNHFQPVAYNDKIWVIGAFTGTFPNEKSVADIYTYTPATNTWAKQGTIPNNRRRGSTGAVLHDQFIYIVGGNTNGHKPGAKPWLDRFNPATGEWQILTDAPTARDHITATVSANKLVVAAGRQSAHPNTFANTIAMTNVYDLNSRSWSVAASIPTPRAGAMSVTVGQEVVIIGGEVGNRRNAKNTVESYNVISDTWRQLSPLQVGRHSGAAVVLNNKIHVISGSERTGGAPESTEHEILNFTDVR